MERIKQLTVGSYTFTGRYYDDDGIHVNVDTPCSLTILDGSGATVTTVSPTHQSGDLGATIAYSVLSKLDTYSLVWTGTTQGGSPTTVSWTDTVELVGGYLFEISELRNFNRAFTDLTKYPTATLRAVRTAVEQVIEGPRAAQVAFVPRASRVTLSGNSPDLRLGYNPLMYGNDFRKLEVPDFAVRSIYTCKIDTYNLTSGEIAEIIPDDNQLFRSAGVQWPAWPWGVNNITLHYTHGYDRPPGAITRAALILATEYLLKSDIPGRATATSIGDQFFRITVAGRDGITGLPEVDAAIAQHGRNGYGIG